MKNYCLRPVNGKPGMIEQVGPDAFYAMEFFRGERLVLSGIEADLELQGDRFGSCDLDGEFHPMFTAKFLGNFFELRKATAIVGVFSRTPVRGAIRFDLSPTVGLKVNGAPHAAFPSLRVNLEALGGSAYFHVEFLEEL